MELTQGTGSDLMDAMQKNPDSGHYDPQEANQAHGEPYTDKDDAEQEPFHAVLYVLGLAAEGGSVGPVHRKIREVLPETREEAQAFLTKMVRLHQAVESVLSTVKEEVAAIRD